MNRLRAVVFMTFLVVTVVPYAVCCLLWAPLPLAWRYRLTLGWPRLVMWGTRHILGIRVRALGTHNLPDGPAIILSKHQSAWETFYFAVTLPRHAVFVYKRELNYIPFFGWSLALLRMIPIDRRRGRQAFHHMLRIGRWQLREGRWPVLFPEGTRVAPGQSGIYKQGGALLACRTGVPIIPVAHNAGECWPRNAFVKRPGLVTVSYGPPIDPTGQTPAALNRATRDWIEAEMRRLNPERYTETAPAQSADAPASADH